MWEASLGSGGQGRHFPGPGPSLQKPLVSSELPLLDLAPSSAATRLHPRGTSTYQRHLALCPGGTTSLLALAASNPKFRHKWASLVMIAPSKASTPLSTVTFQKTMFHAGQRHKPGFVDEMRATGGLWTISTLHTGRPRELWHLIFFKTNLRSFPTANWVAALGWVEGTQRVRWQS